MPLRLLDTRGEGRFEFLKSVFQSSHPAFDGHRDAWQLPVTDPHYPAYDVARGDAACAAWPSHSGTPSADDLLGEGTGVGLSVSLGIAQAHGGSLDIMPAEHGACFRLTLPSAAAMHLDMAALSAPA